MNEYQPSHLLSSGALELDTEACTLLINHQEVHITPIEYAIMRLLLQHPGRVFSRQDIIASCWPEDAWVAERTVDVNIGRLRRKLGESGSRISSRIGFGYMLVPLT